MKEKELPAGHGGHECETCPYRNPQTVDGQVVDARAFFLADAVHRAFQAGRCFESTRFANLAVADPETLRLYLELVRRIGRAA
jgi:hypothetical protein